MDIAFKKFDLSGKTAFVTGGGTGLGYFMSRGLARSGARVMIAARREEVLADAAKKLAQESNGNEVLYTTFDLSDRASVRQAADHATNTLGGVDIFIGNAAQDSHEAIDAITEKTVDSMLEINVVANMFLVKLFLPHMRRQKWGRVIFSSSVVGNLSAPEEIVSIYSTVKGALNAFTRSGAGEAGHDGITFNSLNLGIYRTDIYLSWLKQVEQMEGPGAADVALRETASNTALGRLGECEEVEGVVQMLASDAGSYVTGANISIDGGISVMLKANEVTG